MNPENPMQIEKINPPIVAHESETMKPGKKNTLEQHNIK